MNKITIRIIPNKNITIIIDDEKIPMYSLTKEELEAAR